MRRYFKYRMIGENFEAEYFITEETYFKNIKHNEVRVKIKKHDVTIKRLNIPLEDNLKLNKECQQYIEERIRDFCKYELKEVLTDGK